MIEEPTLLDYKAYNLCWNYCTINFKKQIDLTTFIKYKDVHIKYYNEARKIFRKEKLINLYDVGLNIKQKSSCNLTTEQKDELISDLYNIRSFDDIVNDESKLINNIIRSEKIEKLNKLFK